MDSYLLNPDQFIEILHVVMYVAGCLIGGLAGAGFIWGWQRGL